MKNLSIILIYKHVKGYKNLIIRLNLTLLMINTSKLKFAEKVII